MPSLLLLRPSDLISLPGRISRYAYHSLYSPEKHHLEDPRDSIILLPKENELFQSLSIDMRDLQSF